MKTENEEATEMDEKEEQTIKAKGQKKNRELHIARGLHLPAEDFLEQKTAILGKSGGGKTGCVKVILEELCEAKMPFVVIDPVGIHYGLRSSFDGKKPAYKILVVGGEHSNIPLDKRSGADVARVIVEKNISCVIDLTGMTKSAWREFVEHFADELFRINKIPRLVVLEEAQEFIPQRVGPAMGGCYEAVDRGVTIGRNRGLGWVLVGQRPASINKTSLSQCDTVIMFGTLGKHDRKALEEWVEAKADIEKLEEFTTALAGLENREAWIWSPVALKEFRKFKTKEFTTYHPDKTHLRRHGMLNVKPVEADIEGAEEMLQGSLKALAEQKKDQANLPGLKRKIADLEARLAKTPTVKMGAKAIVDEKAIERAIREALDTERKRLNGIFLKYETKATGLLKNALALREGRVNISDFPAAMKRFMDGIEEAKAIIMEARTAGGKSLPKVVAVAPARAVSPPPVPSRPAWTPRQKRESDVDEAVDPDRVRPKEVEILRAVAELQAAGFKQPTKKQIALWVGLKPTSGGFANYLGRLRSMGHLEYPSPGRIVPTHSGLGLAGDDIHPPNSPDEFQDRVFNLVGPAMTKILKNLISVYPNAVPKPELAEACGHSPTSGGFANYLGKMRTLGIIEYRDGGVVALPVLFLEEDA